MSDDKHTNHAAESHLRSQQASSKGGGHAPGGNFALLGGKNADAMMALVQGHGNILADAGASSANSGGGAASSGGGTDSSPSSQNLGGGGGGVMVNTASADSRSAMDYVSPRSSFGSREDREDGGSSGGRGR